MVLKKIQYKEKDGKMWYDFGTRKLETWKDAYELEKVAKKGFPQRKFRVKNKYNYKKKGGNK